MTGPEQLRLPWAVHEQLSRAAFVAAPSNAQALSLVESWPKWPSPNAAIHGPAGSGKTHLLTLWAERATAAMVRGSALAPEQVLAAPTPLCLAIDDAHLASAREPGARALFHALNRAVQEGGAILLSGELPPAQWPCGLPDLSTRLSALPAARIDPPEDELLAAVLTKLFADRQLRPPADLIGYVAARMERSLGVARTVVAMMDEHSLRYGTGLSFEVARRTLEALTTYDDSSAREG